ncbi:MAG: hypothetical protein R2867_19585 [Caldilineaceae bacterium]
MNKRFTWTIGMLLVTGLIGMGMVVVKGSGLWGGGQVQLAGWGASGLTTLAQAANCNRHKMMPPNCGRLRWRGQSGGNGDRRLQ